MTNWPNTIQYLDSDDIISLGIKCAATVGDGTKKLFREVVPFVVSFRQPTGGLVLHFF